MQEDAAHIQLNECTIHPELQDNNAMTKIVAWLGPEKF